MRNWGLGTLLLKCFLKHSKNVSCSDGLGWLPFLFFIICVNQKFHLDSLFWEVSKIFLNSLQSNSTPAEWNLSPSTFFSWQLYLGIVLLLDCLIYFTVLVLSDLVITRSTLLRTDRLYQLSVSVIQAWSAIHTAEWGNCISSVLWKGYATMLNWHWEDPDSNPLSTTDGH